MTELFLKVVNMSITAGILAVVVMLLRLILKKAPRWMHVLLWGLVAVRLMIPVPLESSFSLMPQTRWIEQETIPAAGISPDSVPEAVVRGEQVTVSYPAGEPEIQKNVSAAFVLACIWLAGIAVLVLYTGFSYIRVYRRVQTAFRIKENVWQSADIPSPFVFGIFRPKIYLPTGITEEHQAYVIAHEKAHIRRHDHWWKPLGFLLLTIHWFNPVLWLAYILLCRDIEMACDERVVKEYDMEKRADYSAALLRCSVKRSMIAVCPLAFGEVDVKTRIKAVLNYRKPAVWIVGLAVIAGIVTAMCFLTDPPSNWYINTSGCGLRFPVDNPFVAEECDISIIGEIHDDEFKGSFTVDGKVIDAWIDMGQQTPSVRYYEGSTLKSHGILYVFDDLFTRFALETDKSNEYILLGMTIEEFEAEMQKKNYYVEYLHGANTPESQGIHHLTLDDVIRLSEKGESLTWEDFTGYKFIETGSGLYIRVYEIDETFSLMIGDGDFTHFRDDGTMTGTPWYIRLCSNTWEDYADVTKDDVAAFIAEHQELLFDPPERRESLPLFTQG